MRLGLLLLLAALPAAAQEAAQQGGDPMEQQRCVWRCLTEFPGADSAGYNACVASRCAAPGDAPAVPATAWSAAPTPDGRGQTVSARAPLTGATFHVICAADGQRFLALFGPRGPDAALNLWLDAAVFTLPFRQDSGGLYAAIAGGAPEWQALRSATSLVILNAAGETLFAAVLDDTARSAITAACP